MLLSDLPMGQEPEVGVEYLVPCLDLTNVNLGQWEVWLDGHKPYLDKVAIIGNFHKDPEFRGGGGEHLHVHLDTRFIGPIEISTWKTNPELFNGNGPFFSFPIVGLHDCKELPKVQLKPKTCFRKTANLDYVRPGGYELDYRQFEDDMEKHTLKLDNPICPHHGTSLKSQCIRDGKVVCPLHGAIWDTTTGKLVRKTKKRTQEEIEAGKQLASIW